eukprot:365931-Chlamydomonas_euryale.AAC.1
MVDKAAGRCTLTATCSPVDRSTARYTCKGQRGRGREGEAAVLQALHLDNHVLWRYKGAAFRPSALSVTTAVKPCHPCSSHPHIHTSTCTCASDAAAIGSSPNSEKISSIGRPSSASNVLRASTVLRAAGCGRGCESRCVEKGFVNGSASKTLHASAVLHAARGVRLEQVWEQVLRISSIVPPRRSCMPPQRCGCGGVCPGCRGTRVGSGCGRGTCVGSGYRGTCVERCGESRFLAGKGVSARELFRYESVAARESSTCMKAWQQERAVQVWERGSAREQHMHESMAAGDSSAGVGAWQRERAAHA